MPVIVEKSIHSSPKKLIEYILNPDKNEEMKYVTGICCHRDADSAYEDFRDVYERYAHEKFRGKDNQQDADLPKGKKRETVLLFHYIQSFSPGEVTPELAHKIGVEFAKRAWGSRRAVLISTHEDKEHTHNHFAVSVFNNKGERWYGNKASTRKLREASDKLAKQYGLSVIEPGKEKRNYNYAEWLAKKSCTSWKEKIADDLDRLVCDENIHDLKDLIKALIRNGYNVRRTKYLSIRPQGRKQGISSYRLGDGYSLAALMYRIEHKEHVITDAELRNYSGLEYDSAMCLREIQLTKYRHNGEYHKATYEDLMRSSALLCFISENKITTEEGFKSFVNDADEKYRKALEKKQQLEEKIAFNEGLIEQYPEFIRLWKLPERTPDETVEMGKFRVLIDYDLYKDGELEKRKKRLSALRKELADAEKELDLLKEKRNIASENYKTYLDMMPEYYKIQQRRKMEEDARRAAKEREKQIIKKLYEYEEETKPERSRRSSGWER